MYIWLSDPATSYKTLIEAYFVLKLIKKSLKREWQNFKCPFLEKSAQIFISQTFIYHSILVSVSAIKKKQHMAIIFCKYVNGKKLLNFCMVIKLKQY